MPDQFILNDEGNPVPEPDLILWGLSLSGPGTRVGEDHIGKSRISTVFLGLDHNFTRHGPPILWETMVFGGVLDEELDRCSGTREQAEAMHAEMVKRVKLS